MYAIRSYYAPVPRAIIDDDKFDIRLRLSRNRIAELVGLGLLQLDGTFAYDRSLVPAGSRRVQFAEDPFQQPALEQPA